MRSKIIGAASFLLLLSMFLAVSQAAPKELTIGVNFVLSGPAAAMGIAGQRSLNHTLEEINKNGIMIEGEKYTLKMFYLDSKYVPAESLVNLEKFLDQGIRFIITQGTGVSVPMVDRTNQAKVLQLSGCSGSDHLTNVKYPLSFRIVPCNEAAFGMYLWLAKQYPNIKTVAHINPSDEAGFTESDTRTKAVKNVGLKNVGNEFFRRGDKDFMPVATKVAALKPDLVDLGGSVSTDEALAVKALREVGYKGMIVISYSDPGAVVEVAGVESCEGVLLCNTLTEPQNPKTKELQDWYIKNFGGPVPGLFYDMWDPPFMLAEALKKANSVDPVKVAESLRTVVRPNSLFGEMYVDLQSLYGLKSTFCRPIPIGIIKKGKPTHLFTAPWPSDAQIEKLNAK